MAFLYTSNELSERETREKNPIYYSNKNDEGGKRPVLRKLYNSEERN